MDTLSETRISFSEAVSEAIRMEVGRDPAAVYVHGRSQPDSSGGILEQVYGEDRVVALDRAERTLIGAAVGLALEGSHAICEVGATEIPSRGLDQLAEAVEIHRRDGIQVPIAVIVRGHGAATAEAVRWLLNVAGLVVAAPTTPADAKGLLASAVRDPGPVCLLLDGNEGVGSVPEGGHVVPLGEANLRRPGTRATVIAHGAALAPSLAAADELGDAIEVLDLRTLAPLDAESVAESVRRTGKALIVEESPSPSPVSLGVTAAIWQNAFEYLDAAPRHLGLESVKAEEDPNAAQAGAVEDACHELLAY